MIEREAYLLMNLIEAATEYNWPQTVARLDEMGVDRKKLCDLVKKVADEAGVSAPFTLEDF